MQSIWDIDRIRQEYDDRLIKDENLLPYETDIDELNYKRWERDMDLRDEIKGLEQAIDHLKAEVADAHGYCDRLEAALRGMVSLGRIEEADGSKVWKQACDLAESVLL